MNIPTKVVTGKNFDQTFYIHSLDLKTFIKSCPLFMKLHTNLKTFEIETRYENTETILNQGKEKQFRFTLIGTPTNLADSNICCERPPDTLAEHASPKLPTNRNFALQEK